MYCYLNFIKDFLKVNRNQPKNQKIVIGRFYIYKKGQLIQKRRQIHIIWIILNMRSVDYSFIRKKNRFNPLKLFECSIGGPP